MSSGILVSAIFPHAPILVGALSGELMREVIPLVGAIRDLVQQIVCVNPDTVILATPHAPLALDAFGIHVGDVLRGSFAHYGRSSLSVCFENDLEFVDEVVSQVLEHRMKSFEIPEGTPLDHGALVPLYFLWEAGWRGRVVVLSTSHLSERDHVRHGQCVERAARALSRRAVFIGSANLSHRLSNAAPYGYHPRACEFDREIISAVERGDFARIVRIAPELRDLAVECGHRPILIAVGAAGETPRHPRVLSYASVLGVGYMVAILTDRSQEESAFS